MYQEEYKRWMTADLEDADLMPELAKIEGNDDEIKERFAVALKFGTAGLRGVLGAGTNRMNIYVVRQATQGLANWDSGKTTFLRQIVQSLAGMQRRVCVVDERGEIYPQELSGPYQQLPAVDTLSGIPKERAVQMALRTLSPQVIVLDELGSLAETAALEQGFFSGVDFIASVHAASAEEAVRRPQVKALQQQGMLRVLVLLQGCAEPGRVRQIDEL